MKYTPNENQIKWGITAFGVIAAAVILYFIIARAEGLAEGLGVVSEHGHFLCFLERFCHIIKPMVLGLKIYAPEFRNLWQILGGPRFAGRALAL